VRGQKRSRLALLVFAVVVLALVGAAATFVFPGWRWGCPSQAELERARAPGDVVGAFADGGVRLVRTQLPHAVAREDAAYRHARVYRHVTSRAASRAALFVLVCEARCTDAPRLRERDIPIASRSRQRVRQISSLGNNIAVLVTDNDGRSGRELQARVQPILIGLDAAQDPESRCYIQ
jgi:hypothetical protein